MDPPRLAISVVVTESLEVHAFVQSTLVPRRMYGHVLPSGYIKDTAQLVNVLAVCKGLYTGCENINRINLAVCLPEDYLETRTDCLNLQ